MIVKLNFEDFIFWRVLTRLKSHVFSLSSKSDSGFVCYDIEVSLFLIFFFFSQASPSICNKEADIALSLL